MEATTTTPATEIVTFEVGNTYEARSACDYDCVWTFEVIARTAKFVTLVEGNGDTMRVGVRVFDFGGTARETASPFGTYSMSPVIDASRPAVAR